MSRDTKILWVDDEIDLLKPYTIFLNEKGFDVSTATNGADAISLVKENEYNLIILDENMPGLSGIQTLQEIKGIIPLCPGNNDYQNGGREYYG
jgi:DNA-binding response OmpR family regulator